MSLWQQITGKSLTPDLRLALLEQYVVNHKQNTVAIPVFCVIVGLLVAQWTPVSHVATWIAVVMGATVVQTLGFRRFDRELPNLDARRIRGWVLTIAAMRLSYVVPWTSLVVWAWSPAVEGSLLLSVALVTVTLAINSATSSPYLPLYLAEITPKIIMCTGIAFSQGGVLYNSLGVLVIVGATFTARIALGNNLSTRTILEQQRDLRVAKEELERADRVRSSFLATMSHEVRTPLTGIVGMVHLVEHTDLSSKQRDYLETIRYSAEAVVTMLNDILDFSRMQAHQLGIREEVFDLFKVVNSVHSLLRSRADEKGLEFSISCASDVPRFVSSDPLRVRQILLNLASNGIKFTESGSVRINLALGEDPPPNPSRPRTQATVVCTVTDTGIGVPVEEQSRIFHEFSQVERKAARNFGGTGLGLAISRNVVQLMGGEIGMRSRPEGGSVFWFRLPVNVAPSVLEKATTGGETGALRILLVEDSPISREVVTDLLTSRKHVVTVASDGREAVDILTAKGGAFDLVLMDIQMPIMDGLEATHAIKNLTNGAAGIPVVAVTGHASDVEKERCDAVGMVDYLVKPIDPSALYHVVARYGAGGVLPEVVGQPDEGTDEPAEPMSVDFENLLQIADALGHSYMVDFVEDRVPTVEAHVWQLVRSAQEQDAEGVIGAAHDLKSLCALFGLVNVQRCLERIEHCYREGQEEEGAAWVDRVPARFQENMAVFEREFPRVANRSDKSMVM